MTAMPDLAQVAITATLSCNWKKAISTNIKILKEENNDLNALNRLAYAYTQIGEVDKAKKIYRKILSIDRYNIIAQKNIEKIKGLKNQSKPASCKKNKAYTGASPSLFLKEPGKTKTVNLANIASINILSNISIGEQVLLCPRKHSIEVRDLDKTYLGVLPDDIAFRLLRFIKGGNKYQAHINNVSKNNINIFIREKNRSKRFLSQPSFIPPKK